MWVPSPSRSGRPSSPAHAPLYANYVICGFWTGWRPNEACALKWHRVDFQQGKILIREGRVLGHKSSLITLERYNRFVANLTQTDGKALLAAGRTGERSRWLIKFRRNINKFNAVLVVPTGIEPVSPP